MKYNFLSFEFGQNEGDITFATYREKKKKRKSIAFFRIFFLCVRNERKYFIYKANVKENKVTISLGIINM